VFWVHALPNRAPEEYDWLIFEVDERAGDVVILAFWHSRRRPGGWGRR
jgi:hypothetical protein